MPRAPKPTPTPFSRSIQAELTAWMTRRGVSQRKLADLTGLSQSSLSVTLGIGRRALDTNELEAICIALGVEPVEIVRAARAALNAETRSPAVGAQSSYDLAALNEDERPDADDSSYL